MRSMLSAVLYRFPTPGLFDYGNSKCLRSYFPKLTICDVMFQDWTKTALNTLTLASMNCSSCYGNSDMISLCRSCADFAKFSPIHQIRKSVTSSSVS